MKDYHISIFFCEEDGGYIADIPDLAHCAAFADAPEESLAEVLKGKAAWIEAARKRSGLGDRGFKRNPRKLTTRSGGKRKKRSASELKRWASHPLRENLTEEPSAGYTSYILEGC
jgi:predicted RNase H-like HicB family nuclease